jgi:Spy/CpxP family protein refolding chaperone
MHATHSALARNDPTQPAGTISPTVSARPGRRYRFRHAVSLAAIVFALAALFALASTGCDPDRSVAASDRGSNKGNVSGIAALTIDDLPATLNLSAEQRTRLTAAMAELRQDRDVIGHRFGVGGRGRGQDGPWHRGQEARRPRARAHRGDGPARGYEPGGGPKEGFEPPMVRFLEKTSSILSGDQFVTLTQFLAGRRAELRPGPDGPRAAFDGTFGRLAARRLGLTEDQRDQLRPFFTAFGDGMRSVRDGLEAGTLSPEQARDRAKELRLALEQSARGVLTPEQWRQVRAFREERRDRQFDRRTDAQPQHVDRITGMYVRVLGLDDAQASRVRQVMGATIPARQAVAERRAQGTIEPEDFAYEMMNIERGAAEQVRGLLTPDQAKRFDALLDLLPRGLQMGGPMGGAMDGRMSRPTGEPMGGPRGGPMGHHRGRR